ncbi:MAG: hypothetical protein AAB116_04815 [Candidatus Poribacteria bacterium]
MRTNLLIVSVFVFLLLTSPLFAQTDIQRKAFTPSFLSIAEYRSYERSVDNSTQTISQFSSPTAIKLPLGQNLAIDLASSFITSLVGSSKLTGLTDVKTRAVAMLFKDTLMLNAGVSVPNGKSDLDIEETAVSMLLSDKALGFKYNRLGEGLDLNFGGGLAQAFGSLIIGVGAGYIIKGEYTYAKDSEVKYKPGNQLNVTGGFDVHAGSLLLRTDGTYTKYNSDESDSKKVFKEGQKISVEESAIISTSKFGFILSGRYINRGKSEWIPQVELPFGVLPDKKTSKLYGDQINANAGLSLQIVKGFNLNFLGESAFIMKNEDDMNDAKLFGFGGGFTVKSSKGSFLDIVGKYYIGNSNDSKIDLKGFSATTAIRLIF